MRNSWYTERQPHACINISVLAFANRVLLSHEIVHLREIHPERLYAHPSSRKFSSISILLTDIYKGWSKSQHIITDTNIVHSTGYLKHVIDDAMAYQVYIQSTAGGNDTVNNQYGRISPCGDCQGSASSTDSCRIDNHRHPTIDLTVAATAPLSQCGIKVNKHTVPHYYIAVRMGVSVITHVYPDEWNV